ncbi:MAG: 5-(carboxyamino)imidazole ribonucleotide synthase [Ignisphaera sp.]
MKFSLQDLSNLKIGILGGGQLGWMMILECRRYPFKFYVMAHPDAPACRIADKCFDVDSYREMIDLSDIVTYEFEHLPMKALEYAEDKGKLIPRLETVILKHERWREREFYKKHGIPTPRFYITTDTAEVLSLVKNEFNYEAVIKQSKGGYDGKGQYFIKSREDLEKQLNFITKLSDTLIVEEFIDFDYEASIVIARDAKGVVEAYPPTYNRNEKGILIYNYGPLNNKALSNKITEIAVTIATKLNYVGVMAVEFFIKNGDILVNEFAPRVHNTGHYTLDAANVSQFEQHIRAIVGLELAKTMILSYGGMVNVLSLSLDRIPLEVLRYGKLYWYGKNEVKRRRKMGHINIVGYTLNEVVNKVDTVVKLLYPDGVSLYL